MHFTQTTVLLLAGVTAAVALPLEESKSNTHRLFARTANWDASCDRQIPGGGEMMKEKGQRAFTDASQMAYWTQLGRDSRGNAFTESTAYSHYFGDSDKAQVRRMMQVVYNSRLPVDENDGGQGYFINIKCGSDQDDECGSSVLAATSAKPGESTMVLCDRFFNKNTAQTKQDLQSKKIGTGRGEWCQTNEQFPFFEIAGLTLFHEMTHLHDVGERAGLTARPDPDGFDSAGTVDVYVMGGDDDRDHYKNMEPWQAARELKRLWDAHNGDESQYKPTTPTIENAESYAAAALEFLFLNFCGWDVILPE